MVTISKAVEVRRRNGRIKLVVASAVLLLLILIGCYLLQWFARVLSGGGQRNSIILNTGITGIKGSPQSKQRVLQSLTKLNQLILLSPDDTNKESMYLSAATKECIPGRDDTGKEINPTTHRKRECLRHVPLGKQITMMTFDLEERMKMQRPRIGIMVIPGYTSTAVAKWIAKVLKLTGESIHMDIEILTTAHVPVYGYGKSHGYSKLIRVTLPLPLAINDAYYYSMNELTENREGNNNINNNNNNGSFLLQNLDAILDETKLKYTAKPSPQTVGSITELLLRWHCRLSHVAAHTAELTLTLDDILKHPTDTLETILTFVWRQDWEWEGHNHNTNMREERELYPKIWNGAAEEFFASEDGSLQPLLNQLSLLLQDDLSTSDAAFGETIRQSFANEMTKSNNLTAWPCPSFWDGVNNDNSGAAHKIASEMTPNCRDGDPYARCTVNRDRCEVKKDAKCE
jgi:hypothetical protein